MEKCRLEIILAANKTKTIFCDAIYLSSIIYYFSITVMWRFPLTNLKNYIFMWYDYLLFVDIVSMDSENIFYDFIFKHSICIFHAIKRRW